MSNEKKSAEIAPVDVSASSSAVLPEVGPNDMPLTGVVLGIQSDNITYTSKKTNLQVEAKRDVIVLQCAFGIVLCRAFNPSFDCSTLKVGQQVTFALNEYRIDNGVKNAQVRI